MFASGGGGRCGGFRSIGRGFRSIGGGFGSIGGGFNSGGRRSSSSGGSTSGTKVSTTRTSPWEWLFTSIEKTVVGVWMVTIVVASVSITRVPVEGVQVGCLSLSPAKRATSGIDDRTTVATTDHSAIAIGENLSFGHKGVDDIGTGAAAAFALHQFAATGEGFVGPVDGVVLGFGINTGMASDALHHGREATRRTFRPALLTSDLTPMVDAGQTAGAGVDVAGPGGHLGIVGRGIPQVAHGRHGALGAGTDQRIPLPKAVGVARDRKALEPLKTGGREVAGARAIDHGAADPDLTTGCHL